MPRERARFVIKLIGQHQYLRNFAHHPVWSNDLQDAGYWHGSEIPDIIRALDCSTPIEVLFCHLTFDKRWVKQSNPEQYRYARKDGSLYQPANVFIQEDAKVVLKVIEYD